MNGALVYDGSGPVRIPPSMGKPLPTQMQGTALEQLGEVSSRICYDSLGAGRASDALHSHILEVRNHSVYEHANLTVGVAIDNPWKIIQPCLNRRGLWFEVVPAGRGEAGIVRISFNFRSAIEWNRHSRGSNLTPLTEVVGQVLQTYVHSEAPAIMRLPSGPTLKDFVLSTWLVPVEDLNEDEAWISLWLYGSRGFTHEQVRHRFAISQRSTRYVDEDGSPYIEHPLITKVLASRWAADQCPVPIRIGAITETLPLPDYMRYLIDQSMSADRNTYRQLCNVLQRYCSTELGMEKTAARKQARGASRGYLGNALASEMIYSTNITGWRWILSQRKNALADAEIRQIYTPALAALKSSRWGHLFEEYREIPSPDGIGTVLQCGGERRG